MKRLVVWLTATMLGYAAPVPAQPAADRARPDGAPVLRLAQTDALPDGEIRKVDKEARKLTIRHGPIKNLGMPAMTMVFRVQDPAMLDRVKAGDKIRFRAEKIDGAYTVMHIEPGDAPPRGRE